MTPIEWMAVIWDAFALGLIARVLYSIWRIW